MGELEILQFLYMPIVLMMPFQGSKFGILSTIQRQIFIFSFGGGWINIWGGDAAASFGRGLVATPGKAKEKV
jgi:hypothetical protein